MTADRASSKRGKRTYRLRSRLRQELGNRERRLAYYMVLPSLLLIFLVAFYPIMYSIWLSLHEASIARLGEFVGLQNYVQMFANDQFRAGLSNTVVFTVFSVSIEFVLGLAIALVMNRAFLGRGIVRAAVLVPWAFPFVISAVMWRLMLQDRIGIFNYMLNAAGIVNQPMLSDQTLLLISAVAVDVWKTTPFVALLLLAGLQTIPSDLYEAARVDGASGIQRFWRITLPLLKPAILVAVLFRTLDSWRVYDLFWGLAQRELESLSTFVYKGVRVSQLDFDVGNAAAVFIFVTALLIALVFIKVFGMNTSMED